MYSDHCLSVRLNTQLLRENIDRSVQAYEAWLVPAREIKAQSCALKDAVKSLGRNACPALKESAKRAYRLSSNLKYCLKAIIPTYQSDLQRIWRGTSPRSITELEQEHGTFKTHVRTAEYLVAAVLDPCNAPDCQANPVANQPQPLEQAYGGTELPGAKPEKLARVRNAYNSTVAAANNLHRLINNFSVRSRVEPFSQEPDYFVNEAKVRVTDYPPYDADHW
ncbi:hypothetical protein NQT62_11165 [Limnobacter humi]|uniref:Uncharacterized protein n=1 Tax=Limnobacter humi TaxID=1778671 RepID=A0ABT1WJT0_9BURK|nr:hypothetical protein [Limnobacter humi]MCQ8896992.1 hypothetical protein [Limnobacter humi]